MSKDDHDNFPVLSFKSGTVNLTKYFPPEKYNLVFPATTIQEISQLHKVTFDVCQLSDNPDDGDVYDIGTSGYWTISAQGVKALAFAANIQNIYSESGVKESVYHDKTGQLRKILYRAVVEVQRPDGTWKTGVGEKHLDFEALKARAYGEKRMAVMRQFAVEIVQSGAERRAILQALGMKANVSKKDIKKPFVIPKVQVALDLNKPLDRTLAIQSALQSRSLLYGRPLQPDMLPKEVAAEVVDEPNGEVPPPPDEPAEGAEKSTEPTSEQQREARINEWENASANERFQKIDTLLKETGYKPQTGKLPNQMTPREQARYVVFLERLLEEKKSQGGLPFEDGRKE